MFFFFQAEDGIRDDLVTGVQTCALPICPAYLSVSRTAPKDDRGEARCGVDGPACHHASGAAVQPPADGNSECACLAGRPQRWLRRLVSPTDRPVHRGRVPEAA